MIATVPARSRIISPITAAIPFTTPITFTSKCAATSAVSMSANRICCHIPAFNTIMSKPPSAARTVSAAARKAAASVTSSGTTVIRPPDTSSNCSPRRAEIATRAPRSASSIARAAPMPEEAPVIQTRVPA